MENNCLNRVQAFGRCKTHKTQNKSQPDGIYSTYATKTLRYVVPPDAHCNRIDSIGRRNMIKYLNSNMDHCLACVANDLESSSNIKYQQRCLFVGLII
jgi:hypothetical protein